MREFIPSEPPASHVGLGLRSHQHSGGWDGRGHGSSWLIFKGHVGPRGQKSPLGVWHRPFSGTCFPLPRAGRLSPRSSQNFLWPPGTVSCVLARPGLHLLSSSPAAHVGRSAPGCPAGVCFRPVFGSVPCCPLTLRARLARVLSPAPCFGPTASPGGALALAPVCTLALQTSASTPRPLGGRRVAAVRGRPLSPQTLWCQEGP